MTPQEQLDALWKSVKPAPSKDERPLFFGPSKLAPPGTRVTVKTLDPEWGYAGCGHPVVGSRGVISKKHLAPVGKTAVYFRLSFKAVRRNGDPDQYWGNYTLFFPDECLALS